MEAKVVVQAMGNGDGDSKDRGENLQGGAFDWAKIHTFSFDFSLVTRGQNKV